MQLASSPDCRVAPTERLAVLAVPLVMSNIYLLDIPISGQMEEVTSTGTDCHAVFEACFKY